MVAVVGGLLDAGGNGVRVRADGSYALGRTLEHYEWRPRVRGREAGLGQARGRA